MPLVLDGTCYAYTPDHASLDITGDIDLRAAVALDDWTPAAEQRLIAKFGPTNQNSYLVSVLTSGNLRIAWTNTGTTPFHVEDSSIAPTVSNGALLLVRAILDVNNGAGDHVARFYTKASTPGTAAADTASDAGWTQLGTDQSGSLPGVTSIFASTTVLTVGADADGTDRLSGLVYAVVVKNGIDGTTVADPDFSDDLPFTDGSGREWFTACIEMAEETDEAFPVSVAPPAASTPHTGPVFGELGCAVWTAAITERGGSPTVVELPATAGGCGRTLNEMSEASVTVVWGDVPDSCVQALIDLEPWRYELNLWREGSDSPDADWTGPISDSIEFNRTGVTIKARDLFHWMERRTFPRNLSGSADAALVFEANVYEALLLDPSPNITVDALPAGVNANRITRYAWHKIVADRLRELSRNLVNFTTVGRTIRVRGPGGGDFAGVLLDEHIGADASALQDGLAVASEWTVLGTAPEGSSTVPSGSAGGIGISTGLVQQVSQEDDITTDAGCLDAAIRRLQASGEAPLMLQPFTLEANAPVRFASLIPGNVLDVRVRLGKVVVADLLTIVGVPVTFGKGGDQVKLECVRGLV